MEEDQYRQTYQHINKRKCVFEKSINSRRSYCTQAQRFHLADREGVACSSNACHEHCQLYIKQLRHKACFALHLTKIDGPLPHAKEIKVQSGGLLGLQKHLLPENADAENVDDIALLLQAAIARFGSIDALPYNEVNLPPAEPEAY